MRETAIPVADAARDFLRVLSQVETQRAPATLMRDGKAVARLSPLPGVSATCAELADRWEEFGRLSPDEASAFAQDVEQARAGVPPLKSAWD